MLHALGFLILVASLASVVFWFFGMPFPPMANAVLTVAAIVTVLIGAMSVVLSRHIRP